MKFFLYVFLFLISEGFKFIQGQCSGGIWPIQSTTIGSFTVSWRYNIASNTVQFIIEGQAASNVNLPSTYIAIGWSDTAPSMNKMDVAMFFVGTQTVQDRYSVAHAVPSVDTQQDFCVILTNISDKNVYVAFERFLTTGDTNDISFTSNLYLMFSMGSYTTNGNTFDPQYHFFKIAYQTSTSLINCVSSSCLTTSCTITSCPCLQRITDGSAQCVCFPPSSCISGSTITPRTTTSTVILTASIPGAINGACQNQINPCSPNGICFQISSTQFICQCIQNYTGMFCQTALFANNMTNINSCQCVNGGTCLTNGTCLCPNRYRGKFCQLNDPCIDYCRNNGICSVTCTDTSCGAPICACVSNYTGVQCETIVGGSCQLNPCINGKCIALTNNTYQCQCMSGYFGSRCELIDSCLSNPCNQGICIPSSNCTNSLCGYSCLCSNGTSGINCENGGNPCLSTPCKNNGSCAYQSNTYACQCIPPYGGTNCELIINVCTPHPCGDHGNCVRDLNILDGKYRCECFGGYMGTNCEYLNGCASSPCRNNGQCVSSTADCPSKTCSFNCMCLSGTSGIYCEQTNTSCLIEPCLNGGTCITSSTSNITYCQCPSNTIGVRCETIQSRCTSETCFNNGVCYMDASTGNNILKCICSQGYTGQYCQTLINSTKSCLQNPCGYNGTCISTSNSTYYCICPNGIMGQSCTSNILTSCSGSPCHYLSTCKQILDTNPVSYKCICPDYLIGDRCEYANNCQKQPCANQGTCIPLGPQNNFVCSCPPGFGHYDCSIYLGLSCNANVCLNGGICQINNGNIQCNCPSDYAGARCEWNAVCSSDTCSNGGICRQTAPTMAECLCATGFTGPTCSLRDSCANFPCKNGAACTTLLAETGTNWSAYRCLCPTGFYGQNCDTTIMSCANMLCPSYKICSEQPTGPICTCAGGKVGTFCQYDNPCTLSSTQCFNGGTCVPSNTDPPVPSCLCTNGFLGLRCDSTVQSNPCASNPCQTRGYCALSLSNTSYTCICLTGYIGDQCERANPCLSFPCLNQGICQGYWNATNTWYTCRCAETYTGTRCETSLLNPCGGLCMNGSPCVNGTCVCPPQYTGTFCGFNNPCYNSNSICLNGGFCSPNFNSVSVSFTCTCPSTYTGNLCQTSIYMQLAATCTLTCLNGGSCLNGVCMCTSQYVGPACQYESPCVKTNPCLNSGTCFGRYNTNGSLYTQCFCLQGYTGINCEATICSSTSCNGGTCIANQNSFICTCPSGKTGDRCQYADVCANNPCLSTERCEQTGNQYQCISCYDQSSYCSVYQNQIQYCDNRYSLIVNNVSMSVLQACQRSCGQCNTNPRSNDNPPITEQEDEYYTTEIPSTTTTTTPKSILNFQQNIIFSRDEEETEK